jgi:hypothetical protein
VLPGVLLVVLLSVVLVVLALVLALVCHVTPLIVAVKQPVCVCARARLLCVCV